MISNYTAMIGDRVQHIVTGFKGIITSHAQHLAGCDRFWIEPEVGTDGKPFEGQWADIDLVRVIDIQVVPRVEYARRRPGGFDLPPSRR